MQFIKQINLFLIVCTSLVAVFLFTSCEKNAAPLLEETTLFSSEKLLTFESEEDFYEALQRFVDTEERSIDYERDISPWEEDMGFTSMRSKYEYLHTKFDNLSSEAELTRFASRYADWINFSNGSYQMRPILSIGLMNILTPEGTVEIADALYKYTPNSIYIVLDKDKAKLANAVNTGEANEEEGVFIINDWRKSEVDFRSCGSSKSRSCIAHEINDKRVRGDWEIQMGAFPVRNQTTLQVTGWTVSYYYDIRIKGERRNFFNNWRTNRTRLGFETGFGIFSALFGTTTSGTGWVSGSNVSSIDHNFRVQGPATFSGFFLPAGVSNFNFTYATCGAKDANVPPSGSSGGLFCYDCCPWDCSDRDWNNIQ